MKLELIFDEQFDDFKLRRGPIIYDFYDLSADRWFPKRVSKLSLSLLSLRRCAVVSYPSPNSLLGVGLKLNGEFCPSLIYCLEIGDIFKFGIRVNDDTGARDRYSSWSPSSS